MLYWSLWINFLCTRHSTDVTLYHIMMETNKNLNHIIYTLKGSAYKLPSNVNELHVLNIGEKYVKFC